MRRHLAATALLPLFILTVALAAPLDAIYPGRVVVVPKSYPDSTLDGYNLYLPQSYGHADEPYPVLVFLQGSSGVGGDVSIIANWGVPLRLARGGEITSEHDRYLLDTFIVIMPHISEGQYYEQVDAMTEILDEVIDKYAADPTRVYMTGLSRGGHGTWGLAARMPGRFAAIVPAAGNLGGVDAPETLADMPIWISHNTGDTIAGYGTIMEAAAAIVATGGEEFTRIEGFDPQAEDYMGRSRVFTFRETDEHNAWTELYTRTAIFQWMLQFRSTARR